jgi:hypothetical protein
MSSFHVFLFAFEFRVIVVLGRGCPNCLLEVLDYPSLP